MPESRRILVLGSEPHTRLVTAHKWDNLPRDLNVADYDVVILNLVPFSEEGLAQGVNLDTLPSLQQFTRLLFSKDSEIIAIGYPGIELGRDQHMRVPWWLPITPQFTRESVEVIRDIRPEFEYYFQHVGYCCGSYSTQRFDQLVDDLEEYLGIIDPAANHLDKSLFSIAQTRYQRPVAWVLIFEAERIKTPPSRLIRDSLSRRLLAQSGPAIWLPPPTNISPYEAVDLILRERYGLRFEKAPPEWAEPYKLPNQLPIELQIAQHEQAIQETSDRLACARQRLGEQVRFRKILYEQGEDVLEPIVRDALRELAPNPNNVVDPEQRGREDGRILDLDSRNGMLEIKGRTGSLRVKDVRELDQWVRDAIAKEDWHSKGMLIFNGYCDEPPGKRNDPFPPNCLQTAQQFGQCLMTTTQLFRALCSHQRGELDTADFWKVVFGADGVCPLPELEAPEEG